MEISQDLLTTREHGLLPHRGGGAAPRLVGPADRSILMVANLLTSPKSQRTAHPSRSLRAAFSSTCTNMLEVQRRVKPVVICRRRASTGVEPRVLRHENAVLRRRSAGPLRRHRPAKGSPHCLGCSCASAGPRRSSSFQRRRWYDTFPHRDFTSYQAIDWESMSKLD